MNHAKDKKSTRREQADASRRIVLLAARDAFTESGYDGATMADFARRSGLAVQTVSYFFGTKARLLSQLIVSTVRLEMGDTPPMARAEWEHAMATSVTGRTLIDVFVDGGHPILTGTAPLMDVARIGGLTDPEVAEVYDEHEAWRRRDFEQFTAWLSERGALREGLTHEAATDITLTINGPDTYRVFAGVHGWDSDTIRAWMKDALKRLLLP